MPGLNVHLGVHKTGTTYLQRWLDRSTFQPGTRWVNEAEARQTLMLDMPIPDYLESDDFVILSDENLFRMYRDNAHFGLPHPRLNALTPDAPHLFLALRNYADYFASLWVEQMRWTRFWPFNGNAPLGRRWPDLLRDLSAMFPNSPITVWDFADFRDNEADIAQLICGDRVLEFGDQPVWRLRQRLSQSAVEELSRLPTPPRGGADIQALLQGHPITKTNPRFDPFTPATRAPFDDAYAEDWAEIGKYATIWRPSPSPLP